LCFLFFSVRLCSDAFKITTTANSDPGSLRQAMSDANGHVGSDLIIFTIPTSDPRYNPNIGVWTITPVEQLPVLIDRATKIDGNSQALFIGKDPNPFGPEMRLTAPYLFIATLESAFKRTASKSFYWRSTDSRKGAAFHSINLMAVVSPDAMWE